MFPRPLRRLASARLLVPIDTWERHVVVARLLGIPESVLDVGGRPGLLALLLPDSRVVVANVRLPADVVFDGVNLPFADASFDAVASIDVVEHVTPEGRAAHIGELARVARRRVVACWPLGSIGHEQLERELAAEYEARRGTRHPFLDEHLRHGLPDAAESTFLAGLLPGARRVLYHGDVARSARRFRDLLDARSAPLRYVRRRLREPLDVTPSAEYRAAANRVFVAADL